MTRTLFFIIILFFIVACAQVSSPSGGPKDEIPPRDSVCSPPNYSTLFIGNKISIRFTEFINLKDLKNNLIVSPFTKTLPEVTVKGKILQINIKDTLEKNTTYLFNFGNAIVDITEGNVAENFSYAFSTGTYLDSSKISGKILNSFTFKPEQDFLVMLYLQQIDSLPMLELPYYLAKTNKEGIFLFSNIKKGNYKIFALKDNNRNYLFDLPDEEIAFQQNLISTDTNITLYSFKEDNEKQFVKKYAEEQPGKIAIYLNKPSEKLNIVLPELQDLIRENYYNTDSIIYWLKNKPDSEKLKFIVYDTDSLLDTLQVRVANFEKTAKEKTTLQYNLQNAKLNLGEHLAITFSRPINVFNDSAIKLFNDTVPIAFKLRFDGQRKLQLEAEWKENANYTLTLLPASFTDIYNYKNDSIKIKFSTYEKKFYGSLQLKIAGEKNQQYIFQLLNEKEQIVKQELLLETGTFNYKQLLPGKYKLRVIFDANLNGKWDTGKYIKNVQPEKVINYSGEVNIRSNWEHELKWEIKNE